MSLADLLTQTTPAMPNRWEADLDVDPPRVRVLAPAGVWVQIPYDEADARLVALAPDLAKLAIDMAAELELRVCPCCESDHQEPDCPICPLLARFAALDQRATTGGPK